MLSGFVLTWNYLDRMGGDWSTRATVHFLWLRLARVWPVYLLTMHLAAVIVLLSLLVILQVYVLQYKWWLAVAYSVPAIIFPLFIILFRLKKSNTSKEYHQLSTLTKLVMFTGILSMIFFRMYF